MRGSALNALFGVNGIQKESREFGRGVSGIILVSDYRAQISTPIPGAMRSIEPGTHTHGSRALGFAERREWVERLGRGRWIEI